MAKSKLVEANEKIAEKVVDTYKKTLDRVLKIRLSAATQKSRTPLLTTI